MKKAIELPISEEEQQYRNVFNAANDGLIIIALETGLVVDANPAACKMHGYTREDFIGLHPTFFIHPDSHLVFDAYLQAFPLNNVFDTRILHTRQDGLMFYAEWRGTTFTYQGRPSFLGIVRDVSKRIQAEHALRHSVEAHTQEQAMLLEISHTLASTLELQPALILDQLREIIAYTHGALFALKDNTLSALAMRGTQQLEQSTSSLRIQLQAPETLTSLFNMHQPIRIADIRTNNPQARFFSALFEGESAVLLAEMRSWLWIPLAVRGRIIGGIGLAETSKDYFTTHHADLALSVANQAAITMINAELNGQAQTLAVLEERQRLARNLHDAVNQSLFSAGLIAEVLPRLWDRDQDLARQSLEDLRRLTRSAQAEMRALLAELRPSTLVDSSLGDLLGLLGNTLSGRINVPVIFNASGEFTLPAEVQIAFYRICQEALYNIAKHAKASQVEIILKQENAITELRIRDNGLGFNTQQTFSGHYGLSMMHERADAAGVLLIVASEPGKGTELTIRWPKIDTKEAL